MLCNRSTKLVPYKNILLDFILITFVWDYDLILYHLRIPVFHWTLFLQVWQLGSPNPNFTLEGHEKGVNCVDYYTGGDKPYLISGADDRLCKIWDYQVKLTLESLTALND